MRKVFFVSIFKQNTFGKKYVHLALMFFIIINFKTLKK